jgi:long-chain acyl-CoA synthetase
VGDLRPGCAGWACDGALYRTTARKRGLYPRSCRRQAAAGRGRFRKKLAEIAGSAPLQRIVSLVALENGLADWRRALGRQTGCWRGRHASRTPPLADLLASIVYTSGTTGRPKGVMLTHENLLWNAFYASQCADFGPHAVFLSFLPLSHTLERTAGYYLPMLIGAEVAYARSIAQLALDLQAIRPTVLVSVPRIYERVYGRIQGRLEKKGRQETVLPAVNGWALRYSQGGRWTLSSCRG